jgi:hypothetical protein
MYEKVIAPRMMAKYHPDRLREMLAEIGDDADEDTFQESLNAW